MTLRLSRRVPGLMVAALAIYLLATNSEVVWLYGLVALLLALIPVGVMGPLVAVRRVRIAAGTMRSHGFQPPLRQDAGRLFAGNRVELTLECRGNVQACRFGPLRLAGGASLAVEVNSTGPAPAVSWTLPRRGELDIAAVQVSSSWPLGILTVRRWAPLRLTLVAHPTYVLPPVDDVRGARDIEGEARLRGPGEEFVGLREYRAGDSQRRVHWPTTARTGGLMVIETAVESHAPARYRVSIEPGTPMESGDTAASVAASLAAGSVAAGRPFRLALPGGGSQLTRWRDVLTRLALMEAAPDARDPAGEAIAISARPDGVEVRTPGAVVRVPTGASPAEIASILGGRAEAPPP